jgi:hypothetical protein
MPNASWRRRGGKAQGRGISHPEQSGGRAKRRSAQAKRGRLGKPLRRARAAPSAKFGFLIRVRTARRNCQGRCCGQEQARSGGWRKTRSGWRQGGAKLLPPEASLSKSPLCKSLSTFNNGGEIGWGSLPNNSRGLFGWVFPFGAVLALARFDLTFLSRASVRLLALRELVSPCLQKARPTSRSVREASPIVKICLPVRELPRISHDFSRFRRPNR